MAYFAVRLLLGWLQHIERADRAFVNNGFLIVASGAAHAWAVVYALFIAIHTRAMRYDGYHEGYTEHLPFWISWTETLAVASMGVWWAAGFTTAAIRIIDDDSRGLPTEMKDINAGICLQAMRSPKLRDALAVAHTVSSVGLFMSILLLCVAMALMKGIVTTCELCLCLVSSGFALPHAVVACRHLKRADKKPDNKAAASAEAAAQETAALGPQLCVVLALADSPGHAYWWQNFTYHVSAGSFIAAVVACFQSPPKAGGAALPPEPLELLACTFLQVAASAALLMCFPHFHTWYLYALLAMLATLLAALRSEGWRDLLVDLLEPLFAVRSGADKLLPGPRREGLRCASRATAAACALVALWDIALRPVARGGEEQPTGPGLLGASDLWDPGALLLLRWPGTAEFEGEGPSEQQVLAAAAEALGVAPGALVARARLPQHRLLLFAAAGGGTAAGASLHSRWAAAAPAALRALGTEAGGEARAGATQPFPATLNATLCLHAHASAELARQHAEEAAQIAGGAWDGEAAMGNEPTMPSDFLRAVGPSPDAHSAYMAACDWWTEKLDAYYGADDETLHLASEAGVLVGGHDSVYNADEHRIDLA